MPTPLRDCRRDLKAMTADRDKWKGMYESLVKAIVDAMQQKPPPSPALVKGDSVGGKFVYDWNADDQQRELDAMVAAGVTWVRIDFVWNNMGKPIELAKRLHDQGLKVLGTIVWGRGTTITPEQGRAAAKQAALHVDALEGGNEVNLWSQYPASPEEYAKLFNAIAAGVADAGADVPVISSGMSPGPNTTGDTDPREFLDRALAAGMDADAIGWHPYCQPNMPDVDATWSTLTKMKEWMAKHPDHDVWVTEMGAYTGTASKALTAGKQAEFVTKAFVELKRLGIVMVFWYQGRDGGTDLSNDQHNYGLVTWGWVQKLAYAAFKAAA